MTNTKLEIIGPYTPEHPGPFCTRDGKPVDLRIRDGRGLYPLAGYIGDNKSLDVWVKSGDYQDSQDEEDIYDLMNAREVPVAREFWINEYRGEFSGPFDTQIQAQLVRYPGLIRTIHVREVLPGDAE